MNTTCNHTLRSTVDVLTHFFDVLQPCLLDKVVSLIAWAIRRGNEQLARTGTECLQIVVMSNGAKFTEASWTTVTSIIKQLFTDTAPQV